ncbi:hypothetical protein KR032_007917 [Drosophila birchii]|nr:hypothetical protein KR032_007917 [Drosophila birchii]
MQVEANSECPDVTLREQQQKNKSNGISSDAARSKTNAKPSARIYTSTPKTSYPRLQQYAAVAEPTAKARVGVVALAFDPRIKTAALLFGLLIIGYKSVILAMPYISADSIQVWSHQVQGQWNETLAWADKHQLSAKLSPLLCGLLVSALAYGIVYLDSAVPGVNPPSPFSPRSKKRFRDEKSASLHLGYLCALSCGVFVAFFMYFGLYS